MAQVEVTEAVEATAVVAETVMVEETVMATATVAGMETEIATVAVKRSKTSINIKISTWPRRKNSNRIKTNINTNTVMGNHNEYL